MVRLERCVRACARRLRGPDADARSPAAHSLLCDSAILFTTLALAIALVMTRRPLGGLDRLADEWLLLGVNLATRGTLGLGDVALVLRPPGYPAFIALVLRLFAPPPPFAALTPRYGAEAAFAVSLAQCLLLSFTSLTLFAWLKHHVRLSVAFCSACLFGLNPYSLVLCGLLHYDILHMFLLVVAGFATDRAFERQRHRGLAVVGCGTLWGLATLVRPLTLLLPLFLLLLRLRAGREARPWRRTFSTVALLTAGALASVLPWTARNYRIAGVVAPVSTEGWVALWGSTAMPLPLDPNRYLWYLLATEEHFLPVYRQVTGGTRYSYSDYARNAPQIEAAFRREALRNLRLRPLLYIRNAARSCLTLNLQVNSVLLAIFQRFQAPRPGSFARGWPTREGAEERRPTDVSLAFEAFSLLLTLLALLGFVRAVRQRDTFAVLPGAMYACVVTAHTLTYMDFMYYYIKLPFLVLFAALGTDWLCARGEQQPRERLLRLLPALLAAGALALSVWLWCSTAGSP